MNPVVRRYSFKLYPTTEQRIELERQAHMMGDLWNALLQRQEDTYRRFRQGRAPKGHLSFFDMTAEITQLRAECPEWAALSVWSAHRVAKALDQAFQAFFRRAKAGAGGQSGYPRYRPYRMQAWVPHRFASGCKLTADQRPDLKRQLHWNLRLKGVPGNIHAMGRFPDTPADWADADLRL